jgi:hypothetical protein
MKALWLAASIAFALCFGIFMKNGRKSLSACFEWTISFWYGLLLVMWAMDLFPSAVKHYKVAHAEEYEDEPPMFNDHDHDQWSQTLNTEASRDHSEPSHFKPYY